MAKKLIVAQHAGFCFGVRRATECLGAKLSGRVSGERLFTLGHLIHNELYNAELEQKGVRSVVPDEIPALARSATDTSPVTLFIRAHGIPKETEVLLARLAAEYPAFHYEDCTCPYVKKIQNIAEKYDDGEHLLLLFGAAEHPEVVGILSHFSGEAYVFPDAETFRRALSDGLIVNLHKKSPIAAAQTTFHLSEWQNCQEILKKVCTSAVIFDTICKVTDERQSEAKRLATACDSMIVIGGRESSNTAKLYAVCREHCAHTVWVVSAEELAGIHPLLPGVTGIVAGASTPGSIIEEVVKTMSEAENFEAMLEKSIKTLNTGDTVTGLVTRVTDQELQLDLGTKVTGVIKAEQITDDPSAKLTSMFKVGDEVEAFVIRVSDVEGVAELSKKRVDADKNIKTLVEAEENKEVVEGKVTEVIKGGVIASVNSNRVFIPAALTGVPKDGDLNTLVGTTVKLRIIEVKGKNIKGSIRSVLREEKKAQEAAFWANIEVGKKYTGKVKSMTDYGAFVDLGGVDGMVHKTELSWKHIKTPADVVKIGDEITVFVKSFDPEKKRISLGYKTEETEPWYVFTHTYQVGDVAAVKIVNMMPFGAFAEIVDGVDGLIHISQIAQTRIGKPSDVLEIGQIVDAKIIDIDNEKKKVSLSIRALLDEAQAAEEAAPAEETAEEAPASDEQ